MAVIPVFKEITDDFSGRVVYGQAQRSDSDERLPDFWDRHSGDEGSGVRYWIFGPDLLEGAHASTGPLVRERDQHIEQHSSDLDEEALVAASP